MENAGCIRPIRDFFTEILKQTNIFTPCLENYKTNGKLFRANHFLISTDGSTLNFFVFQSQNRHLFMEKGNLKYENTRQLLVRVLLFMVLDY